ncbi:hypothetical protein UFOVP438_16 [uncultured Caudovirales phage]|uniref:Uncharacterized protein n=1 Tax=uncultured Caudovirales phage TaxID=2100421 RepID=A0A6J5M9S1_9CAUD|nr:hypothetical protein UFOVP438_16 [uncultured Caudovirales phage]
MPSSAQVSVNATATVLVAATAFDQTVYLHNSGGGVVYLGAANVTTANGYKLDNGDKITIGVGDHEALYAVTASGTNVVSVLTQIN